MNEFIKKRRIQIAGILVGAVGGYLYYHFVGCASGTCPITSNPYVSIAYGALLGYLLSDIVKIKEKKDGENKEVL